MPLRGWARVRRSRASSPRVMLLRYTAVFVACLGVGGGEQDTVAHTDARYSVFMFPPPGMCFPSNSAVYVATALSDGLFADLRITRGGFRLRLRINDVDMASVDWHAGSSGEGPDEGLAHHFSIPGLPDGDYDADLSILAAGDDEMQVGHAAQTSFQVDSAGKCKALAGSSDRSDHSDGQHTETGQDVPQSQPRASNAKGSGTRKGRSGGRVLVNVAVGKKAWMSSVAEGSNAMYGCDGLTMVSTLVERNAISANSSRASDVWWEVDLGSLHDVHLIDVWTG